MKFIISLALFVSSLSIASTSNPYTYRLDTSSTNLVATFPLIPQLTGPANAIAVFQVSNGSSSEIEVNCSSSSKPGLNSSNSVYVPGSTAYQSPITSLVVVPYVNICWMRSVSGTISSGVIEITAVGY